MHISNVYLLYCNEIENDKIISENLKVNVLSHIYVCYMLSRSDDI